MITKWTIEFLWWLMAIILAMACITPILYAGIDFPFVDYNIFFIILGTLITKTVLFFNTHPLHDSALFKFILIIIVPFMFFPMIEGLHSFIEFMDHEGIQSLLKHLPTSRQHFFSSYIPFQYLLFGLLSFLGSFVMIIKMLKALWRQYKYSEF